MMLPHHTLTNPKEEDILVEREANGSQKQRAFKERRKLGVQKERTNKSEQTKVNKQSFEVGGKVRLTVNFHYRNVEDFNESGSAVQR